MLGEKKENRYLAGREENWGGLGRFYKTNIGLNQIIISILVPRVLHIGRTDEATLKWDGEFLPAHNWLLNSKQIVLATGVDIP